MKPYKIYVYEDDKLHELVDSPVGYKGECPSCSLNNSKLCDSHCKSRGSDALCRSRPENDYMIFKEVTP